MAVLSRIIGGSVISTIQSLNNIAEPNINKEVKRSKYPARHGIRVHNINWLYIAWNSDIAEIQRYRGLTAGCKLVDYADGVYEQRILPDYHYARMDEGYSQDQYIDLLRSCRGCRLTGSNTGFEYTNPVTDLPIVRKLHHRCSDLDN